MLKKHLLSFAFLMLCLQYGGALAQSKISIIPQPTSMQEKAGSFTLPKSISISLPDIKSETARLLKQKLSTATGYSVSLGQSPKATISLQLNKQANTNLGAEGYQLTVSPTGVQARANTEAGLYYAAQTLLQLLPPQIEQGSLQKGISWTIPAVDITDSPRFGWRGLMLDVSRHFFSKADVKKYIDQMARYKYNLLHWHLTDDEGWRIEIKAYPNLTQKGAYNAQRVGYFGTFAPPPASEPRTYGGFYTQDDIREIVAYAKARHIDIMPEIDVPGHSLAAVVAYPELSFTPGVDKYQVRSGEVLFDWSGPHVKGYIDNTLNPANEKVYTFLDKVFQELTTLFPYEYIHIGGDECPKNFWEKDAAIAALAQKEGLKSMEEVQSYFTKRVVKIINAKGKKVIGWDEILEGGLADGAAVMSWRGEKGGIEAARQGHEVVMTPTTYCYIDYMQGDSATEAKVYASLRLKKAYEFNPVPAGVDPKLVKGGQANLWSEQLYTMRYAEYMTWPRALATAECLWSLPEHKNWNKFTDKVENHFARLEGQQTNYSPALYDPEIKVSKGPDGQPLITLSKEIQNLNIHYSWDNAPPDAYYPVYAAPLSIPKEAHQLKLISYRGQQKLGRLISIKTTELYKRMR